MYSICRLKSLLFRIRCSQNRRCQIDFSFFFNLDAFDLVGFRSSTQPTISQLLLKWLLIKRQRSEKSASPSGNVQMQCRWSGKRTKASILNGCCFMTFLNAWRSNFTLSDRLKIFSRRCVTTVKKQVPPLTCALRYLICIYVGFRRWLRAFFIILICIGYRNNIHYKWNSTQPTVFSIILKNWLRTTDNLYPSFCFSMSFTNFGLAWPLVSRITWPTKNPNNFVLPP